MKKVILSALVFVCIAASGQNVGIGISTPFYKLDVLGEGRYSGTPLSLAGNIVSGGTLLIANSNGQTLTMDGSNIQAAYADPLTFPRQNVTHSMVINPYGGNVGIGTNFSPEYKLHLWASTDKLVKIDGNNSLLLFHDNVSNAQYGFFRAWTSSPFNPAGYYGLEMGTPPSVGGDPAKRLMFSTNYNLRLLIMEDGKVGINTITPNSKLEVNGSLAMPIRQVDAVAASNTYTISDDDYTIICDMQGQGVAGRVVNLLLPSPAGRKGRLYNVTAINMGEFTSANPGGVRIYVNSVVPGTEVWMLTSLYQSSLSMVSFSSMVTLQCDGNQWRPVSSNEFRYIVQ